MLPAFKGSRDPGETENPGSQSRVRRRTSLSGLRRWERENKPPACVPALQKEVGLHQGQPVSRGRPNLWSSHQRRPRHILGAAVRGAGQGTAGGPPQSPTQKRISSEPTPGQRVWSRRNTTTVSRKDFLLFLLLPPWAQQRQLGGGGKGSGRRGDSQQPSCPDYAAS